MDALDQDETNLILVLRTLFDHQRRAVLAFALGMADLPDSACIDHVRPVHAPQPTKH